MPTGQTTRLTWSRAPGLLTEAIAGIERSIEWLVELSIYFDFGASSIAPGYDYTFNVAPGSAACFHDLVTSRSWQLQPKIAEFGI